MKILFIQHSPTNFPATVGELASRLGHSSETIRIDGQDAVPSRVDADALIMFGGAMSLASCELPAWVTAEQALIRSYISEGQAVLGICLGAQLLASALGANVQRNRHAEVGWHPIKRADGASSSKLADLFPEQMTVLQWHQDTFEIPSGAIRLFESEACQNQAFAMGDRVLGFQFHFEANRQTVATFLETSPLVKQDAPFIQSESEIRAGIDAHLPTQAETLERFLERWLPTD